MFCLSSRCQNYTVLCQGPWLRCGYATVDYSSTRKNAYTLNVRSHTYLHVSTPRKKRRGLNSIHYTPFHRQLCVSRRGDRRCVREVYSADSKRKRREFVTVSGTAGGNCRDGPRQINNHSPAHPTMPAFQY